MAERPLPSPLPADLPENWALDQIVAPDGTSVGLTQQHGYNYLMEQVNAAHRGVNAINESFDTISGKRTCRFVVGTSTAGWTEADCDYLCDGVDDQAEIQAAIDAVPSGGGEIVLLAGKYQITGPVTVPAAIALRGSGISNTTLNIQKSAYSGDNSSAITLFGSLIALQVFGFSNEASNSEYLVTGGNCRITEVSFWPDIHAACVSLSGGVVYVMNCIFHTLSGSIALDAQNVGSNSTFLFHSNYFSLGGSIVVSGEEDLNPPLVSIIGNHAPVPISISLDNIRRHSIVACNILDKLELLHSAGGDVSSKGCLIANNVVYPNNPGPCITLGEDTRYNFVTGNQIVNPNNGAQKLIQDSGEGNIVRFNSNDTGGGSGASGVASFNGRTGTVMPQAGDYTAGMVGARPDTWTPTAADVGAVTGQGVQTIQTLTQAEYDALTAKDPSTLYIIKE